MWHTLEQSCHKVPSRHHLLIAGDLNSTIKPQSPHVGSASTPSDATNHSTELQQLIVDLDLCALNTFHSKPKHTYFSPQTSSQIDFVLCRRTEARGQAFHAHPLHSFPCATARRTAIAALQPAATASPGTHSDVRSESTARRSAAELTIGPGPA